MFKAQLSKLFSEKFSLNFLLSGARGRLSHSFLKCRYESFWCKSRFSPFRRKTLKVSKILPWAKILRYFLR